MPPNKVGIILSIHRRIRIYKKMSENMKIRYGKYLFYLQVKGT